MRPFSNISWVRLYSLAVLPTIFWGCSGDGPTAPEPPIQVYVENRLGLDVLAGSLSAPTQLVPASLLVPVDLPPGSTTLRWVSRGRAFSDGTRIPDDLSGGVLPVSNAVITAVVDGVRYFTPRVSQLYEVDTISFALAGDGVERCFGNQFGGTSGFRWGYYVLTEQTRIRAFGGRSCSEGRFLGSWSNAQLQRASTSSGEILLSIGSGYPLSRVVTTPTTGTILVGGTTQLSASLFDAINRPITNYGFSWTSSDSTVASVSSGGLVTGRRAGTATISATVTGYTVRGESQVTVREPTPTTVRLCDDNYTTICFTSTPVLTGASLVIRAQAFDSATDITSRCTFQWVSSDTSRVRVAPNAGGFTAVATRIANGTSSVLATCQGVTGVFTLN